MDTAQLTPRTAGGSAIDVRFVLHALLFVIGIAAVAGIAVALAMGEATIALVIGIVAGAFFSRITC